MNILQFARRHNLMEAYEYRKWGWDSPSVLGNSGSIYTHKRQFVFCPTSPDRSRRQGGPKGFKMTGEFPNFVLHGKAADYSNHGITCPPYWFFDPKDPKQVAEAIKAVGGLKRPPEQQHQNRLLSATNEHGCAVPHS